MQITSYQIKNRARTIFDEMIQVRRHIHRNPELSYKEFKTSDFIAEFLNKEKIPYKQGWVKTGITAEIKGGKPGGRIALRADMDALPINEAADVEFKSHNPGIMHACGHDVHTTCLLGAVKILNEFRSELKGTVQVIFQPGEEKLPGGANLMIKEGIFDLQKPDKIIGQHVYPQLPAGKVGFRPGKYMASADELYLTIKGKGGHAALPHNLVDPIVITSHLITAMQQLISRNKDPLLPAVLTFGYINGSGATNIIPEQVELHGTFRAMNEEFRAEAHKKMRKMAQGIVEGMGGELDFKIDKGYPYLENDDELTEQCMDFAREYLGEENVEHLDMRMTAEDFAYYSQLLPGCFYRLGTGFKNEENFGLHHPKFKVDENAIETGIGLMAYLTVKQLEL